MQDPTAGGILLLPAVLRFHPSVRSSFFFFSDHGLSGDGLARLGPNTPTVGDAKMNGDGEKKLSIKRFFFYIFSRLLFTND